MINLFFYMLSQLCIVRDRISSAFFYRYKPALYNAVGYLTSLLLSILLGAVAAQVSGSLSAGAVVAAILFLAGLFPNLYPRGALFINAAAVRKVVGANMSGTTGTFAYAYFADIASWPAALTTVPTGSFGAMVTVPSDDPFVMNAGKYFYLVDCILEEGEVKFTQIAPRDCAAFENMYDNVYPGNDAAYIGFNAIAANEDIVCIATELNGAKRVIGFPNFPARAEKSDGTSGKKVADGRKNNISFVARGIMPPPVYLADIPLAP